VADPKQTISVEVPEGMDAEKLKELVLSYEARRVTNTAYRKARNAALKDLIAAHKDEYEGLLKKHSPKAAPKTA